MDGLLTGALSSNLRVNLDSMERSLHVTVHDHLTVVVTSSNVSQLVAAVLPAVSCNTAERNSRMAYPENSYGWCDIRVQVQGVFAGHFPGWSPACVQVDSLNWMPLPGHKLPGGFGLG